MNDAVSLEMLFENALQSLSYVNQIINILKKRTLLGVLTTSVPYHGKNFSKRFNFNPSKINTLKQLVYEICPRVNIPNKDLFTVGDACWCKRQAIAPIMDKISIFRDAALKNINLMQTIIPYIAQKQGYYTGEITNIEYASIMSADYLFMLQSLVSNTLVPNGVYSFNSIFKINKEIVPFCRKFSKIYIYGAGDFGYRCLKYIYQNNLNVTGFVVSDGYKKNKKFLWFDVYELSEIVFDANVGIIVAVDNDKLHTMLDNLSAHGVDNYITFREDSANEY